MEKQFRLPDIGEGLAEAEIVRWLVPVGGHVDLDQVVVEVETDKAVVEIPSPYAGTLVRRGAEEGETLGVGEVLLVIVAEESAAGGVPAVDEESFVVEPPAAEAEPPPIVGTLSTEAVELAAAPGPSGPQALPRDRRLARELGVDLESVEGSGTGGRITREDVERAAGGGAVSEPPPADERRPLSRVRKAIAANMERSWSEIPHVTTFDECEATRLLAVRRALSERHGTPVPIDALLVAAVVPVLSEYPEFNARLDGDELVLRSSADIGLAVDTADGLLVAVIRHAERLGVLELADEVRRLGEGAKRRALKPDELFGQSFTVSNIGAVGGGYGTPIIPYGTTAILSTGRAVDRPVARGETVAVTPVMPLSMSFDHRVIDGALGRRFMARLTENLAEPALFLA